MIKLDAREALAHVDVSAVPANNVTLGVSINSTGVVRSNKKDEPTDDDLLEAPCIGCLAPLGALTFSGLVVDSRDWYDWAAAAAWELIPLMRLF